MKIAIIVSQFNKKISDGLLEGAGRGLKERGAATDAVDVIEVPGSFEIPQMAQKLIDTKKYAGIIALGAVIKGETGHYRAVCDGVTYGIQKVAVENRVPVMLGVLMCEKIEHATARSAPDKRNKGYECAIGLLELIKKAV